ncbi:MAG: hypothetical protein ACWGQW_25695 [bacterium]
MSELYDPTTINQPDTLAKYVRLESLEVVCSERLEVERTKELGSAVFDKGTQYTLDLYALMGGQSKDVYYHPDSGVSLTKDQFNQHFGTAEEQEEKKWQ